MMFAGILENVLRGQFLPIFLRVSPSPRNTGDQQVMLACQKWTCLTWSHCLNHGHPKQKTWKNTKMHLSFSCAEKVKESIQKICLQECAAKHSFVLVLPMSSCFLFFFFTFIFFFDLKATVQYSSSFYIHGWCNRWNIWKVKLKERCSEWNLKVCPKSTKQQKAK